MDINPPGKNIISQKKERINLIEDRKKTTFLEKIEENNIDKGELIEEKERINSIEDIQIPQIKKGNNLSIEKMNTETNKSYYREKEKIDSLEDIQNLKKLKRKIL